MKGHTVIQLFDAKTGELTDEVVKDNLVTDAVNNIIKGFDILSGKFLNYSGNKYDNNSDNGAISAFSIVKRFMDFYGGIMIFNDTVEESVISPGIHEINSFIGCASTYELEHSSDFDGTRMGRLNKVESEFTENKLRFVYDFSTSACNGDIASICLTSSEGGKYGLNTYPHGFVASPRFSNTLSSGNSRSLLNTEPISFYVYSNTLFKLASDGYIYTSDYGSRNNCGKIDFNSKIKQGLGFLDNSLDLKHGEGITKLYDLPYPECNIDTNSDYFIFRKNVNSSNNTMTLIYRNFITQEEEEKVYDFTNVVNKIKEIYPSFSASNIKFFSYSDNKAFTYNISGYTFMINLDTMDFKYLEHTGFSFGRIISLKDFYIIVRDFGDGFSVLTDKDFNNINYRSTSAIRTYNIISIPSVSEPIFLSLYGTDNFIVDTAIDRCYLATINNQDVVLTKTPDKTMKIIYTLTEE